MYELLLSLGNSFAEDFNSCPWWFQVIALVLSIIIILFAKIIFYDFLFGRIPLIAFVFSADAVFFVVQIVCFVYNSKFPLIQDIVLAIALIGLILFDIFMIEEDESNVPIYENSESGKEIVYVRVGCVSYLVKGLICWGMLFTVLFIPMIPAVLERDGVEWS